MHNFKTLPNTGALRWSASASALTLAFAPPALAQSASDAAQSAASPGLSSGAQTSPADPSSPAGTSGDIIVTATRQSSALSKVPISLTALNQQSLDVQGVKKIDDIANIAPGLNFVRPTSVNNAGNRVQISIRGVESSVGASTTGIYVDDTPVQTRNAGFTSTSVFPVVFDLDRAEVLRGPQGRGLGLAYRC